MTTPRAGKTVHSPEPPASGLALALRQEGAHLLASGSYRLPEAQARALAAVPLLPALALVAMAGGRVHAWNPWDEALAFPDDEDRGPSTVEGYFEVDVTERFPVDPGETVYVLACLGPERSPTASLVVR